MSQLYSSIPPFQVKGQSRGASLSKTKVVPGTVNRSTGHWPIHSRCTGDPVTDRSYTAFESSIQASQGRGIPPEHPPNVLVARLQVAAISGFNRFVQNVVELRVAAGSSRRMSVPIDISGHISWLTYFLDVRSLGKLVVKSEKASVCLSVCLSAKLQTRASKQTHFCI
jgi:hypothetical protein